MKHIAKVNILGRLKFSDSFIFRHFVCSKFLASNAVGNKKLDRAGIV